MGKVVPQRRRKATPSQWTRASDYRGRPARRPGTGFAALLVACFLATFTVVFLWGGVGPHPQAATGVAPSAVSASFARCSFGSRAACVVDGDTIWLAGTKIRMADFNTPEVSQPGCAYERRLGERATTRLLALLNSGAVTVGPNPEGRDRDRYGRALRIVRVDGTSVGDTLVAEGLAEPWRGYRRDWC